MSEFARRLAERVERFGPLCVGIDPSRSVLAACGLPDSAEGARAFGKRVLDSVDCQVAVIKPQSAYFERFGSAGIAALEDLALLARAREVLVLLDAKRGDIDSTATAYGEAFFPPDARLRVDAVTVHAYLGFDALGGLLELAHRHGAGVFPVVRSSNREGEALQTARTADGTTVALALAGEITAWNRAHADEGPGPVGAVVGATCADAAPIVEALPASWILAPGVGAQGASFADVARRMPAARGRVLANVARGILAGGGSRDALRTTLLALREEARTALNAQP